jgi:hypothetical protein
LGKELAKIMDIDDIRNPQGFVESIFTDHECMVRIEQVNSRILQLFKDWESCSTNIDPDMQDEVRELARAAKAQAVQLRRLCNIYAQRLQTDSVMKDW